MTNTLSRTIWACAAGPSMWRLLAHAGAADPAANLRACKNGWLSWLPTK